MILDYNQLADDYARHRRVHPGVIQNLLEQGEITQQTRLLEVGCGTGNYLVALAGACGCAAWGIDPSDGMLEKAQQRLLSGGKEQVVFLPGIAERLDFPSASFDLVFSVDVIHDVQDRAAFFRDAWRVLATGGRLCTVTDSEDIIRKRRPLSAYFPETVQLELGRYPPIPTLRRLMEQAGFTNLVETQVEVAFSLADAQAFRRKAYSSLHLISEEAFQRGLRRMEADLERGPISCISYYVLLWGSR
jgi:ubiquinone/menaquinone biosynthesis C-methylase UbiE